MDEGSRATLWLIHGCLLEGALGERIGVSIRVFDAMLETFAEAIERDTSAGTIDSIVVRAHHCVVGRTKGIRTPRRSAGREAVSPPRLS